MRRMKGSKRSDGQSTIGALAMTDMKSYIHITYIG